MNCPICRTECPIPEQGIEGLPKAFYLNNLLELHSEFKKRKEKQEKCFKHNEPLKLYCETCGETICLECAISTHQNHNFRSIEESYPQCHQELEKYLQVLDDKISSFTEKIEGFNDREAHVARNGREVSRKITLHAEEIINQVMESKGSLIKQVDHVVQEKLQSLSVQRRACEQVLGQMKYYQGLVKDMFEEWSMLKILKEKQVLVQEMDSLTKDSDETVHEPIENADVHFQQQEYTFGKVEYRLCEYKTLTLPPVYEADPSLAVITLRDEDKCLFGVPRSSIAAKVIPLNGTQSVKCIITDCNCEDGTYNIHLPPLIRGEHLFEVTVGGTPIPNSPFKLLVVPQVGKRGKPFKIMTKLNGPWGVAALDGGDVIVVENKSNCLTLLPQGGIKSKQLATDRPLVNPRGIAVDPDQQHLLVTDDHRVLKVALNGNCIAEFGSSTPGKGCSQLDNPMGIAFHPFTGQVFVADYNNHRIQILYPNLTYSHSFASQKGHHHQFNYPSDVKIGRDGFVYVAESESCCVKKFSPEGVLVDKIGSKSRRSGSVLKPFSLVIHGKEMYIAENSKGRVSVFDTDKTFLNCFGEQDSNTTNGFLSIAIDRTGNLYVTDFSKGRLIVY